ncbi:hypothetical protein C1H69_10095 [Billgrantia endophytica]|uniref:Uncharacterized protein n=1 Tax=Billgrantia endophytica TaxID=2033802 RepID=A0A2N7U4B7_9GAMM|nr:hypothetical protein C1H69_10095 [Halomonas endophytica]
MKKSAFALSLVALSLTVSSAVSADSSSIDDVLAGALACTDSILEQSRAEQEQQTRGEMHLYSVPYEHAIAVQVGTSYSRDARIQYIPVIETSYLDGTTPGSAWSECMQARGLPTPTLPSE